MPILGSSAELAAILRQFNPWWSQGQPSDLPGWRRSAFRRIETWLAGPSRRALLLTGARQVGKTTLLLQAVESLRARGVPVANILYATFDHPLLKLAGLEAVLRLWREQEPAAEGPEYLLLDEIQAVPGWQTWLKHQVDFARNRRIVATGSAVALADEGAESGVGRWTALHVTTLSFHEYLRLRSVAVPSLPRPAELADVADWTPGERARVAADARPLVGLFHDHLLRGGFPQIAALDSVTLAQKLLREDIVDRVLKRDMTALFGVRRVLELEQVFLYLCLHDGGLLDMTELGAALQLRRPTVSGFIGHLEAAHLVWRLLPHGYGKQVLRGKPKVYLADPAIAPSVLLRGKSLLDDADGLARAVEACAFKHLFIRYADAGAQFSYWRGRRDREVDIVVETEGRLLPFEVKYRGHAHTGARDLRGLIELCQERSIERACVLTRELDDLGPLAGLPSDLQGRIVRIPAALACLWLGQAEEEA
jgi:predicted AAA+ superfamily ATPase